MYGVKGRIVVITLLKSKPSVILENSKSKSTKLPTVSLTEREIGRRFQQKGAHKDIQNTPPSPMVEIFRRHQWLGFFKLLRGYDDDVA